MRETPPCDRRGQGDGELRNSTEVFASLPALSPSSRCEYLLAELRCASLRARLIQADIDAIGLALKTGLISPDEAVELLADIDLLRLVGVPRDEQVGAAA
jgi:hypothetical protein